MRTIMRVVGALALAGILGGCGTSLTQSALHPDRPEIASGRLESDRVRSGCPIRLRLVVRDAEANVARALASWSYDGTAGVGNKAMHIVQDGFALATLMPEDQLASGWQCCPPFCRSICLGFIAAHT